MHEAGLIAGALEEALGARGTRAGHPIGRRVAGLGLEILDPVGISLDAARLHLAVAMAEHGLTGVPVTLSVAAVRCAACGAAAADGAGDPFCASCGWPLPRSDGAPLRIVIRV